MGTKKEKFYEPPVDRTPYGACAWVALAVLGLFLAGSVALWRVAGMVKHGTSKAATDMSANGADALEQARKAAEEKASEQADQLRQQLDDEVTRQKNAAVEAAKEEANKQIQEEIQQQKEQFQQYLTD